MKETMIAGLSHKNALTVTEALTVPNVSPDFTAFSDMPPVFASAFMIAFFEATCIDLMRAHLDDSEHSVGIGFDLTHLAATPVGMEVRCEVILTECERGKLSFKVEAWDEKDLIGTGIHKRAIIKKDKFMERVQAKLQ